MSNAELDMLCHLNAQCGPHLYQADEGGRIKIMFTDKDGHEDPRPHHHTRPHDRGGEEITHHEPHPGGDGESGSSHEHGAHEEHTHEGDGHEHTDATSGHHHHEKGVHTAERDINEHYPA